MSTTELLLNRVSMAALLIGGLFFIYEGSLLINTYRDNPKRIPQKVAVAGSLTIILGILSIAFAILHLFLSGGDLSFIGKR